MTLPKHTKNSYGKKYLISVGSRLERTFNRDVNVLGLFFGQFGQLDTNLFQVQLGNLFVQVLRQDVHLLVVFARFAFVPQFQLRDALVGERARHDKRRVTSGTAQVEQTTFGQDDDAVSVREFVSVALRLDVHALGDGFQTSHVNFVVKVTNVTDDGVVLHVLHVRSHDDILVTGGSDEDVTLTDDVFERGDLVAFHRRLQRANRIDFRDNDTTARRLQRSGGTLADVTVTGNPASLTGNHDIGGSHDTVRQRVSATVQVIEFALGNGVVDVDRREQQFALLLHFI